MSTGSDPLGRLGAALVGIVVGGLLVLGAGSLSNPAERAAQMTAGPSYRAVASPPSESNNRATTLLLWAPGGLPAEVGDVLRNLPQVTAVTEVVSGTDMLRAATGPGGDALEAPPAGFAIPIDAAAVEPRSYSRFVPPAERAAILSLRPGDAVIAATAAELRGGGFGSTFHLGLGEVQVAGIVSDVATNGYEMLLPAPAPNGWGRTYRSFLIQGERTLDRARLSDEVERLLPPGTPLRVRAKGESPYLRYGDAVLPEMELKEVFGEFAMRGAGSGTFLPNEAWKDRNIVTAQVPLLGRVTCHRIVFPQLRSALRALRSEGLGHLVAPDDYGGCFSPRHINRDPAARLSHHSWGIAIDINVSTNAFGSEPDQDRRLVTIFEDHGFTWGGRWLLPDGMHFEWVRFP